MNKANLLILIISLSICLTSQAAEDKKKSRAIKNNKTQAIQQSLTINNDLNTLFVTLEKSLNDCRVSYEIEMLTLKAELDIAWQKGEDSSKVFDELEKRGHPYKKCISDNKETFNSHSQSVMNEIKDENLKTKTRAVLAQWLTTLDAIPEKNFQEELSKYKSLRNNFLLEFPAN